jgi:membrane-associated phospholipid phosphatase
VALYGVQRLHSPARWLLLLYPLTMSTALVYFGEHYVIDVIAGFALAGLVLVGCQLWENRRRAPGSRIRSSAEQPAPATRPSAHLPG